jgi:hypothetical protein
MKGNFGLKPNTIQPFKTLFHLPFCSNRAFVSPISEKNMFLNIKFVRVVLSLTLLLTFCVAAFADTIRLKDGSVVKGRVIGFKDGKFVVVIGEGSRERQMTFFADEIDKIDFEAPAVSIPAANTSPRVVVGDSPSKPASSSNGTAANNPNVIVVGRNRNSDTPSTSANTNPGTSSNSNTSVPVRPNNSNISAGGNTSAPTSPRNKPIMVNVKVLADNTSNGWTNSGWVVKKGQRIRITGSGRISLGSNRYATPEGVSSLSDPSKLKKDEATGGLIVVIGDDNNDFIFIGSSREFIAQRDGVLFLGINEGNLNDNSGAFDVNIEIDPTIYK